MKLKVLKPDKVLVIGIDASNLRDGGGVTHLIEILSVAEPARHGIEKVILWGGDKTLSQIKEYPWLEKIKILNLDSSSFRRTIWQRFKLSRAAKSVNCDLLFIPGGGYIGSFRPFVTMSRNTLPFAWNELKRFGFSLATLRLIMLRIIQSKSFHRANGVIFLTEDAKTTVQKVTGELSANVELIPHGINPRFEIQPKEQYPIDDYSEKNPFRILYVSPINQYKHQWNVVEAIAKLRSEGLPLKLDLVGGSYKPALERLIKTLTRLDPNKEWVCYHGAIDYSRLHTIYAEANLGVFASSCENMPNILLETMAAGIPVASSDYGPMPEILGDCGIYFDPEQPEEIELAIKNFLVSPELRAEKASASFSRSQSYSWKTCASYTFEFLAQVAKQYKSK